jgi:hypothetical protein
MYIKRRGGGGFQKRRWKEESEKNFLNVENRGNWGE